MGKRHSSKRPQLTKKRFRRSLAALGLLVVWLAGLSVLVLTSSHASADRSSDAHGRPHPDGVSLRGSGTSYSGTAGEEIVRQGASEMAEKIRQLCADWHVPGCDVNPGPGTKKPDGPGPGFSWSNGGFQGAAGGTQGGNGAADGASGRGAFSAGFGGAGGFGGSGSSGFVSAFRASDEASSPSEKPDPIEDSIDALAQNDESAIADDPIGPDPAGTAKNIETFSDDPLPSLVADSGPSDNGTPDGPVNNALAPQSETQAVPEPLTLSLFVAGLIGAGAARSRKSRKAQVAA